MMARPRHLWAVTPRDARTADLQHGGYQRELPNTDHHCGPSTAPLTICYV